MEFSQEYMERDREIAGLFEATFFATQGYLEGSQFGELARNLMYTVHARDLYVFTADSEGALVGAVAFSRLSFEGDERIVFMLSPMAVAVGSHFRGVGPALIRHGLDAMRHDGVQIVITYGEPRFYAKLGFSPISTEFAPPPYELTLPEVWQGLSLTDRELTPLAGPSRCVPPFDDPVMW